MLNPNLNKIMEEFVETVEETTFKPVMTVNEGEIQESIAKPETKVEEGRKMKR